MKKTILVDPGHGLYYSTAKKVYVFQRQEINGVIEDLLTIETGSVLIQKLLLAGYNVLCTRHYALKTVMSKETKKPEYFDGAYLFLSEDLPKKIPIDFKLNDMHDDNYKKDVNCRFIYANKINKTNPISLLLSIHYNAGDPSTNGTEVWYQHGHENRKKFATLLSNMTARACGFKNRGAKGEDLAYAALRVPDCLSVIWEIGFFTSVSDSFKMKQNGFYERVAQAAVDSIIFADKNGLL